MKKQLLMLCLALAFAYAQGAVDYNGNPLARNGSITITPQTSSATIASYTKAVNLDGLVDKTFGANGIVITNLGGNDYANACVLQPDGKIIAAGSNGKDFALVRYNTNGSLDTTFGINGKVTTNLGGTDRANTCVLQPDGKIIAAGTSSNEFALVRYLSPFTLETFTASYGNVGLL